MVTRFSSSRRSESPALVRDTRRAVRADTEKLLNRAGAGKPVVLGVGEVLPFSPARRRAASLPIDVARTIEEALSSIALDVVHVHEPFAPSASSVALRHSRALNVASFHVPTERVLSTQLTGALSRPLFSRLDARTGELPSDRRATAALLRRRLPRDHSGGDPLPAHKDHEPVEIAMIATEERAALRVFLRALRALPRELEWHATVASARPLTAPATLERALRDRVSFVESAIRSRRSPRRISSCSHPTGCGRPRRR